MQGEVEKASTCSRVSRERRRVGVVHSGSICEIRIKDEVQTSKNGIHDQAFCRIPARQLGIRLQVLACKTLPWTWPPCRFMLIRIHRCAGFGFFP